MKKFLKKKKFKLRRWKNRQNKCKMTFKIKKLKINNLLENYK